MRELTNAELDIVGGGSRTVSSCKAYESCKPQPCGESLVKVLVADILKILESNSCNSGGTKAA